tara:strand:+ start:2060 stop:2635 length:576 start_codon:yes stop_codon:yes gene_type:complete
MQIGIGNAVSDVQKPFAPVTVTITDTDHDGMERTDTNWYTDGLGGWLANLGASGSGAFATFHFETVNIEPGTQVKSAIWSPYVYFKTTTVTANIYAEKIADAALPSTSNKASTMTLTTDTLAVNAGMLTTGQANDFDLTDVFNEIFAQSTWKYGNSINLIGKNTGGGTGEYFTVSLINHANANGTPVTFTY